MWGHTGLGFRLVALLVADDCCMHTICFRPPFEAFVV